MIGLLCFALAVLASPFKSKLRLEAEKAVLRHQLLLLRRGVRAPGKRDRIARADPADEHGEPALGCATYPRRTAQARIQRRSINRRQVHGQTTGATQPGMANLSAKPCSGHCRHGPVRGPDHWLQTAVWLGEIG